MLRNEWLAHLDGLVVFRGLLAAEPLCTLRAALAADDAALTGAVAAFEAALFARGTNWTDALLEAVLEDENLCLKVAAGQEAGPVLEKAMDDELDFLQALGRAPLDEVFPRCGSVPAPVAGHARRRLPRGLRQPAVRPWARRVTVCLPATMSLRWKRVAWCRCATPTRSV